MKNKLLLATLALPLAFGACTNDDFETVSQPQGANGELVEVGPGFAISASKGGNEAATRGQWIEAANGLNYAWWPNYVYNDKKTPAGYDAVRDEIGLCWVGQSVGTNVYTNYRFQHAGWLNEDETTAEIDPCEPHEILNGYELKDDLSWDSDRYNLTDGNKLTNALDLLDAQNKYKAEGNQYLATIDGQSRNLNSAFFRTPSETLFKGDYIAYLPFTPEMTEAGAVLAHSPKNVTVVLDETASGNKQLKYAHLGSDMFMYAYAPGLVGGTQASNFSFKHLSGLIRVKAKADFSRWNSPGDEGLSGITSITLVDAAGKFVTEVGLDASKIVAEGNSASTGTALYVPGTEKYTNMLTAHIDNNNSNVVQNQTSEISIYIPALPTTTGQVSIVLYNHDLKLSAVYELNTSSIQVKPGQVTTIDMGMIDIEDFTEKVATTEKALYQMIGIKGDADNGDIIRLMGDIELGTLKGVKKNNGDNSGASLDKSWIVDKAVTLNGGKVVVPADFTWYVDNSATINSDIEIENKGCCKTDNGKLQIGKERNSLKVALNGTVDNYGDIDFVVPANTTIATKNVTTITGKLNNHETLVPETGKTNYATITINPLTQVDLKGATVVNDAEFTINAVGNNASDHDGLLNLDSNASITNNYYLTNAGNINNNGGKLVNEKDGWIIDRISAAFGVTQPVNNGGQYVCEVNGQTRLNDALAKSLTTRVRFISNDAQINAVAGNMAEELYKNNVDASNCGGYGSNVGYNKAAYDISGLQAPNIDFEIAAKTTNGYATDVIRLYSKDGSASEGAGSDVKIGKLILTSGWLDVPNFTKFNGKVYEDATFEMESIEVNGEEVQESKLQGKIITVNGDIKVLKMKGESDDILTIGGIVQSGTNGSYELTKLKVGGNFVVGSTEKEDKAAVAFNNNNTTDVKGSFSLYKNGTCDIKVATGTGIDNQIAKVWASSLPIDEGKWANSSKVSLGEHPLW